jgi:hypothetical protein
MYLIPLAWLYVVLMMSLAEATNANGTVLGAVITFLLYGLLPIAMLVYIMGAPSRRRAIRAREEALMEPSVQPDAGGVPPGDAVAPERKEP